ncbi:ASCH domain-containing protein [Endozoicomonas sp. OPT23]|uniref:N(4)-acetylcytidine aminohydrolase n=1 Tax=Endozoicomonas sp. OPT23 TaxID=2072845 RepID=UPI00129B8E69|nr:N(4)-acetylcytidine aminohydrolase [Endozoicomonas sp. OPT23]MRI34214.1 ASCH domain-containing protein [Endozoicomonas sp. OPT23]
MSKEITFYSRFSSDIRSGLKTITIRDHSESDYQSGNLVKAFTNPEGEFIANLKVVDVYPVRIEDLTETHAKQENMSLPELKSVIKEIYPDENNFFVIEFATE